MGKLTYAQRQRLPSKDFVFPRTREYPIEDVAHARNALARVSRFGTPSEQRAVCQAVAEKYPSVHEKHCPFHTESRRERSRVRRRIEM